MIYKARQNLAACSALQEQAFYDAIANRAYFAAYQAGCDYLMKLGLSAPTRDGREYFRHGEIIDLLEDHGFVADNPEFVEDFQELQDFRVAADYYVDETDALTAASLIEAAERIVTWALSNDPTSR